MKVENMINSKGHAVPNQFVITKVETRQVFFQSYETIIAVQENGLTTLDKNYWDYSRTTLKYLYLFLGMNKKEILAGIGSGDIVLTNLN